jgi:sugar phosphate permease
VPEGPARPSGAQGNRFSALRESIRTVRRQPSFLRYSLRQLVYVIGVRFAIPLIPLYYVREVGATDAWIGIIATGQSLALLVGYQLWRRVSVARGGALVLLVTLFANALYPAALSMVDALTVVVALTALAAVFAAGVDLALFDELMKRIPRPYGVTFASIDTTLVNGAGIVAPLLGATVAVAFGIDVALQVATAISLAGVALFALDARRARPSPGPASEPAAGSTT